MVRHAPPDAPLRVGGVVAELAGVLARAGVPEAQAEARDLVAAVMDVARLWPGAHRGVAVDDSIARRARAAASRRAAGMPFAYAVGRAAFRHLTLDVDARVLIPRQETEVLVDLVLAHPRATGGRVADVGTGSGAIALALATEGAGRFEHIIATDVSADALTVARANANRLAPVLRTAVEFRAGSLLAPLRGERLRVLVSNPPYIAFGEADALPSAVRDWEPAAALFSAAEGLSASLALVRGAPAVLEPGGLLVLEGDARRISLVAEAAAASRHYGDVRVALDLNGRERFVVATTAGE